MDVAGVFDAEVSFDDKTAVCTVAKDLDPQKLIQALKDGYSGTIKP